MHSNGIATFKKLSDLLKFKKILDSWLALYANKTGKDYTDDLQRMIPPYKHQPFVYATNTDMAFQPYQPTYLNASPRYYTTQKKKPVKPKKKVKKTRRAPSPQEFDFLEGGKNDAYNEMLGSGEIIEEIEEEIRNAHNGRNGILISNLIYQERNLGHSASPPPQQNLMPIITNSQFTDFDTNHYGISDKPGQRSSSKAPQDSTLQTPKVALPGQTVYEEFYDSNGYLHYKGDTKDGLANGKGVLFHKNGVVEYDGMFADNLLHGRGNLYSEGGNLVFKGDFVDGIRIGKDFWG